MPRCSDVYVHVCEIDGLASLVHSASFWVLGCSVEAYGGSCDNGQMQDQQNLRTRENQCKSCDAMYELTNDKACQARLDVSCALVGHGDHTKEICHGLDVTIPVWVVVAPCTHIRSP